MDGTIQVENKVRHVCSTIKAQLQTIISTSFFFSPTNSSELKIIEFQSLCNAV